MRENSVTDVSDPCTIRTASSTEIDFAARTSSVRALGTAASAARFMAVINASTFLRWPVIRNSLAASFRKPGNSMRTLALFRKPSRWPSSWTAACAPRTSAILTPATASTSTNPART